MISLPDWRRNRPDLRRAPATPLASLECTRPSRQSLEANTICTIDIKKRYQSGISGMCDAKKFKGAKSTLVSLDSKRFLFRITPAHTFEARINKAKLQGTEHLVLCELEFYFCLPCSSLFRLCQSELNNWRRI